MIRDSLGALNPQNEDSEKRIQEPLEMIQVSADPANHINRDWDQPPRFDLLREQKGGVGGLRFTVKF